MKITMRIETDNEAFENGNYEFEVARIIRQVSQRITEDKEKSGRLFDWNGNMVGEFKAIGK